MAEPTVHLIRHSGHEAFADHIADGPEGQRMFACFGCEADVIDAEVLMEVPVSVWEAVSQ